LKHYVINKGCRFDLKKDIKFLNSEVDFFCLYDY
jgi:hypothetical protein